MCAPGPVLLQEVETESLGSFGSAQPSRMGQKLRLVPGERAAGLPLCPSHLCMLLNSASAGPSAELEPGGNPQALLLAQGGLGKAQLPRGLWMCATELVAKPPPSLRSEGKIPGQYWPRLVGKGRTGKGAPAWAVRGRSARPGLPVLGQQGGCPLGHCPLGQPYSSGLPKEDGVQTATGEHHLPRQRPQRRGKNSNKEVSGLVVTHEGTRAPSPGTS